MCGRIIVSNGKYELAYARSKRNILEDRSPFSQKGPLRTCIAGNVSDEPLIFERRNIFLRWGVFCLNAEMPPECLAGKANGRRYKIVCNTL